MLYVACCLPRSHQAGLYLSDLRLYLGLLGIQLTIPTSRAPTEIFNEPTNLFTKLYYFSLYSYNISTYINNSTLCT